MKNNTLEKTIYSVSQINSAARLLLEDHFSGLWIEGEISNLVAASSGHYYFSLKDSNAQLRCAFFSFQARRLKRKPENGMQVILFGKISLYENRGDYQCIVETFEEAGNGQLQREFELLKLKLEKEGLFNPALKKALPIAPQTIGIITSPTGAAIRDILKILKSRYPFAHVIVYPSLVQGDLAPANLIKMITLANERRECDVLILTRGGGSIEDLWAFNSEALARAIFDSALPIISAVGHEIDFTIADFVADFRAPTPSAAAMQATPDKQEWLQLITQWENRLTREMTHLLRELQHQLNHLRSRLPHPQHQLREKIQRIDEIEQRLIRAMQHYLTLLRKQFSQTCYALDTLNPLATLKRGYALALDKNQKVITNSQSIHVGDEIKVKLAQGELACLVQRT